MEKAIMKLDAQVPCDNSEMPDWRNDEQVLQEHLQHAYVMGCKVLGQGRVADYIPELARADGYAFGLVAQKKDGTVVACGDADVRFSIQSVGGLAALEYLSQALHLHVFDYHPYIVEE